VESLEFKSSVKKQGVVLLCCLLCVYGGGCVAGRGGSRRVELCFIRLFGVLYLLLLLFLFLFLLLLFDSAMDDG
jgi:hypothetical protein